MQAVAPEMSYAARVKEVERLVIEIERSDDVERGLELYDTVQAHLHACRAVLDRAQGRLAEVDATAEKEGDGEDS